MSDAPDDDFYLDGEDIAGLGMRRVDEWRLFPRTDEDWDKIFAKSPPKPRKPPKPTLDSIARQARKAGLSIVSVEIKADGSFTVVTGKPESAEAENPWRAEFQRKETKK